MKWPVHCRMRYRRIHPWCALSPYDDALPILCRFCFSSSQVSYRPFQLHNVKMKSGFVISGCADAAPAVSAEGESVISVSLSAKDVGAEAVTPCVDG